MSEKTGEFVQEARTIADRARRTSHQGSLGTPQVLKASLPTVREISATYDEPAWMRDAREEAWELYTSMQLPHTKEEAWRRTPVHRYPMDDIRVVLSPKVLGGLNDLPPCWHTALPPETQVSGTMIHCNGAHAYTNMRREDSKRGVIFTDLHKALQSHSDRIRQVWMRGPNTRPDFNKFAALHAALWHGGTFVHVPAGVRVARPLQDLISYDVDGGTGLHHTLIIAEKGSRVTVIQDRVSQEQQPELNVEVVEIHAEAGAWVRYIHLQHWGNQRHTVTMQDAHVQQNANLLWVSGVMGGQMTKEFMRSTLDGTGARALMQGFSFARGQQHLDQSTYQHHRAPETYSDLLFRNVLNDQARTAFYGMIRVEPSAGGTQGYQASNNLLLSDVRAHAIPGLEIAANDVRCSHGATVSRIDPEQRFYLQARGLPTFDADRLIVQGFLRPIVERVPLAVMRDRLEEEITQRFWEQT